MTPVRSKICSLILLSLSASVSALIPMTALADGGTPSRGNYNYEPHRYDDRTQEEKGTLRGAEPNVGTPSRGNYYWGGSSGTTMPSTGAGGVSSSPSVPYRGNYFWEPTPIGGPSGNVPTRGGTTGGTPTRGNYNWN